MSLQTPVGIVVALHAERKTLAKLDGILVEVSGPGPTKAAAAAQRLLSRGAGQLMSWGTAGALVPDLPVGALIITSTATNEAQSDGPSTTSLLADALVGLCTALAPRQGLICTMSQPACDRASKEALCEATGAIAVDMESAAVAVVAREAGTPFAAVRAVVDPVDFQIPPAALAGMRADGGNSLGPLFGSLLRQPGQLMALCRLGLQFRVALRKLDAAATLLAAAGFPQAWARP